MVRLILFFTLSFLMFGGTSMAENLGTCNADMIPIQLVENEREDPVTTLYNPRNSDFSGISNFNNFVKTVTKHLAAKLAQEKLCLNSTESQKGSLVQFMYISFSSPQVERTLFKQWPPAENPAAVCQIASPWLDIIIKREPVPTVQAIVRFNNRQFLADQAVLEGALNVPPGVAIPFKSEEYWQYARAYDDWREAMHFNREYLGEPIEEFIPLDILWLLKRTFPFSRPHETDGIIDELMDSKAKTYTKVVTTLIDQCFASGGVNIKVNSISDVNAPALLKKYKSDIPEKQSPKLRAKQQ